nr:MAG TPA: hypothetical protein [Caudoviricetes sp.]
MVILLVHLMRLLRIKCFLLLIVKILKVELRLFRNTYTLLMV